MIAGRHLSGEAERNINEKIRSLSKAKIDEISTLIGASFWDYPYEEGEGGLKPFFPSKQALTFMKYALPFPTQVQI